jgi:hypothetical protein
MPETSLSCRQHRWHRFTVPGGIGRVVEELSCVGDVQLVSPRPFTTEIEWCHKVPGRETTDRRAISAQ